MKNLKFKLKKYDSLNPYLKEGDILTFPEGESHYLTLASPKGGNVTIQAKYLELLNGETCKEPEINAQPPQEPNQEGQEGQTKTDGDDGTANQSEGDQAGSEATSSPAADPSASPL